MFSSRGFLARTAFRSAKFGMMSLIVALIVSACDGSESPAGIDPQLAKPPVATLKVNPASLELAVGESSQLTTTMYDRDGNEVVLRNAAQYGWKVKWSTSDTALTEVTKEGMVTAKADGIATITASLEGRHGQARVSVGPASAPDSDNASPDTTIASIRLSPDSVELTVGANLQLAATAYNAGDKKLERAASDFSWSSSDEAVATVSTSGSVVAHSDGSARIAATLDGHTTSAPVVVSSTPEPLPTLDEWDFVVEDTLVVGNVVVPEGQTWLFGSDVQVEGNVIVHGTLAMRPGGYLKFLGANPDQYVGGGMQYGPEFDNDIGLWVTRSGALDIQGTPKEAWNRTGSHPTWQASDEYWIAPTAVGDYEPRRWYLGEPIPQVDPQVPGAEVVNVTRDIVIEGPGHIHIHSGRPQRIEYVQLRELGVMNDASEEGPVLGRYALHMHHGEDGTRGTIVRGVAAVNSKGRVFVPHMSHGITMIDNVSVNSFADALWWDWGDVTNDLLVDRMAVLGVHHTNDDRFDGYFLGGGDNMEIRNSVAAGVRGNAQTAGFEWITGGRVHDVNPVWTFDTGNVAHNNQGPGIRFWTNLREAHVVSDYVSYRNKNGGIENGAYQNVVSYFDVTLVEDWLNVLTSSKDDPIQTFERPRVYNSPGHALIVGHRKLAAEAYTIYRDCHFESARGYAKVFVTEGHNPWLVHFSRCGLTPDDFEFESLTGGNDGSHILIDHEDGRRWEILLEGGRKIVRTR